MDSHSSEVGYQESKGNKNQKQEKASSQKFLTDEEIANSWFFQLLSLIVMSYANTFHKFSMGDKNKLKNLSGVVIGFHTTHNVDIPIFSAAFYQAAGRVPRGLFHRTLYTFVPMLKYIGGVAGYPQTAKELIQSGYLPACIPGGAEEALTGHENAYALHWSSTSGRPREGFARLALSVGTKTFINVGLGKNVEEARFNPVYYVWNLLGLSKVWDQVMKKLERSPIQKPLFLVGATLWFNLNIVSVPIPVPITYNLADPIPVDPEKDKAEELAQKAKEVMEGLMAKHQARRERNYTVALKQRGISLQSVQLAYIGLVSVFSVWMMFNFWQGFLVGLTVLTWPMVPLFLLFTFCPLLFAAEALFHLLKTNNNSTHTEANKKKKN